MLYGSKCNLKLALPFHLKRMRISWLLMLAWLYFFATCTEHISAKFFLRGNVSFGFVFEVLLFCCASEPSFFYDSRTQFNRNASHQSNRNEQLSSYCEKYFTEACMVQTDIAILREIYPVEFHFLKILPFLYKISYSFVLLL